MRFRSLRLRPFGAFAEQSFDFDGPAPGGLHLVYGPNGAGKSTTLKAIRSVLFGMKPGQGAHLYPSKLLRLGAELVHSDGRELRFTRRTSPKNPLWDGGDEASLPEEVLAPFLGGLDRGRFESLFGLDLETMVEGGRSLLRGEGEIGRALFGAGLGGTRLAQVTERIERELSELYAERSQKAKVNAGLAQLKSLSLEVKRASTSPTAFAGQRRELDKARERLTDLREQQVEARREHAEADRLLRALDPLQRMAEATAERSALGGLEPLPAQVIQRVRELLAERERLAQARAERAEVRLARAEKLADAQAAADGELLAAAERIQALAERRTSFQEALQILPERRAELELARREAGSSDERLAADLDLRDAPAVLARLGLERSRTADALRAATKELGRSQLAAERAQAAVSSLEQGENPARLDLAPLAPYQGTLAELAKLVPPHASSIEARENHEAARVEVQAQQQRERSEIEGRVQRANELLERLAQAPAGTPPSAGDLAQARRVRDEAWRSLRGSLEESSRAAAADVAEFAGAMERADGLADRLLQEGEVALEAARGRRELELAAERLRALDAEVLEAEQAAAEADAAWQELWRPLGFEPLRAAAMGTWVERRAEILGKLQDHRGRLEQEHERALGERDERSAEHELASAAAAAAEEAWVQWARSAGLDPAAGEDHARQLLDRALASGEAAKGIARLEPECARLAAVVDSFESDAQALAKATGVGRDADGDSAGERALEQAAALAQARMGATRADVRLGQLRQEQAADDERDQRAAERVQAIDAELASLRTDLGSASEAELVARVEASGRLQALDEVVETARRELSQPPVSATPDELRAELGERDRAAIESLIEEQAARAASLARALEEARETELRLQAQVERDGSGEASRLAAQRASLCADLTVDTGRYLQVRMAQVLLEREIERHRSEHQGPLLQRAGELFRILTLGAYERLVPDEDKSGKSVIAARRPDGSSVGVEGMSTGTCDQLFLALRIASVEQMLRTTEAMPFIADDLFVNFDDRRTEAALEVLFELARSTQVIVFSHHDSVVDTARRLEAQGIAIRVHELTSEAEREAARAEALREAAQTTQEQSPA